MSGNDTYQTPLASRYASKFFAGSLLRLRTSVVNGEDKVQLRSTLYRDQSIQYGLSHHLIIIGISNVSSNPS